MVSVDKIENLHLFLFKINLEITRSTPSSDVPDITPRITYSFLFLILSIFNYLKFKINSKN
jgi:hypothetical protein